jgi:hypothetical protein
MRAFLSYSHGPTDTKLANRFKDWFSAAGGLTLWDNILERGVQFGEKLLSFIDAAHIFVVLLTDSSKQRPWVMQEIGYAAALGVRVVPISTGKFSDGLISDKHCLLIKPDGSDLERRLDAHLSWDLFSEPDMRESDKVVATLTYSKPERVKWLIEFGRRARTLGGDGTLRQRGGHSSFCIPDEPVGHDAWRDYDGEVRQSLSYHRQKREERRLFEKQAHTRGCKLIIDPNVKGPDSRSTQARLRTLCKFLTDVESKKSIQVITHKIDQSRYSGTLTIFGDWWFSESFVRKGSSYEEATFSWHPPAVRRRIQNFDDTFWILCEKRNTTPEKSTTSAIEDIRRALEKPGLGTVEAFDAG